jgi:hypothetical protein
MIRLFLLMTALLTVVSISKASAQETSPPLITRGQLEPVMPTLKTEDMMSNEMANAIFRQCRSFYPRRFTPSSLDTYCDCAMTATQVTMTAQEYADVQLPRNQKASNPTYQKFITSVVAPCMVLPTIEIEYFGCVLDRFADSRIGHVPKYCNCVSREISQHVGIYGDVNILITMSTNPRLTDPFEALWVSSKYIQSVRQARTSCLGKYMKQTVQYNYN